MQNSVNQSQNILQYEKRNVNVSASDVVFVYTSAQAFSDKLVLCKEVCDVSYLEGVC